MNSRILGFAASAAALAVVGGCTKAGPPAASPAPMSEKARTESNNQDKDAMTAALADKINELAAADETMKGMSIKAEHKDGIVTITGSAPTQEEAEKMRQQILSSIGPGHSEATMRFKIMPAGS